jgi:hypothetical protein
MKTYQIIKLQERIGTVPDGFWGPKSIAACQRHLRDLMPKQNPWPYPDQTSMIQFYGQPGNESRLVPITFPFPTFYGGKIVKTTRVHERCADSLLRVLKDISTQFGRDHGTMEEIEDYGGCYNFRNSRGSTILSKHAWGAAIDYDADDNTFRDHWPLKADMPLEIMECFAREAWISAGAFWGYDAMHFQATR